MEIAAQLCDHPIPARQALEMVGLQERMHNFPSELSGGEQQRTAIARALAKNPSLLLCDEPTGALDYKTGKAVLKMLYELSRQRHTTVVIITHNQAIAPMADRIIHMQSGRILDDVRNGHIQNVDEIVWCADCDAWCRFLLWPAYYPSCHGDGCTELLLTAEYV